MADFVGATHTYPSKSNKSFVFRLSPTFFSHLQQSCCSLSPSRCLVFRIQVRFGGQALLVVFVDVFLRWTDHTPVQWVNSRGFSKTVVYVLWSFLYPKKKSDTCVFFFVVMILKGLSYRRHEPGCDTWVMLAVLKAWRGVPVLLQDKIWQWLER